MIATVHLIRLHINRIITTRWMLFSVFFLPIAISIIRRSGLHISTSTTFFSLFLFASAVVITQAVMDRESGLSDGIRTTAAARHAITLSRPAAAVIVFVLQIVILEITSGIITAIS